MSDPTVLSYELEREKWFHPPVRIEKELFEQGEQWVIRYANTTLSKVDVDGTFYFYENWISIEEHCWVTPEDALEFWVKNRPRIYL